jgi:hypothetical protein
MLAPAWASTFAKGYSGQAPAIALAKVGSRRRGAGEGPCTAGNIGNSLDLRHG